MNENRAFQDTTYCAYCGERFPLDDLAATAVDKHIGACPKHPMRVPERDRDTLRDLLLGIRDECKRRQFTSPLAEWILALTEPVARIAAVEKATVQASEEE